MVWPLVFLAVGGASYAVRAALRIARQSSAGGPSAVGRGPLWGPPPWIQNLNRGVSGWKEQLAFITKDMRGFEVPMTKSEAYNILRLGPTASRDKILQTHKQLMLRNHPDNGGPFN
ncbi:hypothetical protein Esti_000610 [Eimeria stiedai]